MISPLTVLKKQYQTSSLMKRLQVDIHTMSDSNINSGISCNCDFDRFCLILFQTTGMYLVLFASDIVRHLVLFVFDSLKYYIFTTIFTRIVRKISYCSFLNSDKIFLFTYCSPNNTRYIPVYVGIHQLKTLTNIYANIYP